MKRTILLFFTSLLVFLTACQSQHSNADYATTIDELTTVQNYPMEKLADVGSAYKKIQNSYSEGERVYFTTPVKNFELKTENGQTASFGKDTDYHFVGSLSVRDDGMFGTTQVRESFDIAYCDSILITPYSDSFYCRVVCGSSASKIEGTGIKEARWGINSWSLEIESDPVVLTVEQLMNRETGSVGRYSVLLTLKGTHLEASWTDSMIRVGAAQGELGLQIIDTQTGRRTKEFSVPLKGHSFDLITESLADDACVLLDGGERREMSLEWSEHE